MPMSKIILITSYCW